MSQGIHIVVYWQGYSRNHQKKGLYPPIRFFDFMFISGIDPKTLGFLNNVVALTYIAIWRMASFIKFHNSKSSTISAWDRTA